MAKFQMIESGVVFGGELSGPLRNRNLRLGTARCAPALHLSDSATLTRASPPPFLGTRTAWDVDESEREKMYAMVREAQLREHVVRVSTKVGGGSSPPRTFSPPSDQASASLTAPAPLDGTQDPTAGHQGGGPQEVEEEGRGGGVDHHQAQEEAEGVDRLLRGLVVPGALSWVLIAASRWRARRPRKH